MSSLVLIVPGCLDTLTGGYGYDRGMAAGPRDRGWLVDVRELDSSFPDPTPAAREQAARILATLPDGATVLVDGLALGAMPGEAEREAARLRLVALVHHPLAAEVGVERAAELHASERRALAAAVLVIVTSQATAGALAGYDVGRDRIAVVEPGTDRAPLARGSSGAFVQLLCVATLTPRKGHEVLLRALAAVPESNWRLTCVGSARRHPPTVERLRALDAPGRAERCFSALGYQVRREPSDWVLPPDARELQQQLIEGWAQAAVAIAPAEAASIRSWRERRLAHVAAGRSRLIVGHEDLAAWLP